MVQAKLAKLRRELLEPGTGGGGGGGKGEGDADSAVSAEYTVSTESRRHVSCAHHCPVEICSCLQALM